MASSMLLINLSTNETEDISEEDHAGPVQVQLLMVCFYFVVVRPYFEIHCYL